MATIQKITIMNHRIISIRLITKNTSFFKTEDIKFKINDETTWKQIHNSLQQRDGEKYYFFGDNRIAIKFDEKVDSSMGHQKIYGISESSFEYKVTDLIFLSDTVLNN